VSTYPSCNPTDVQQDSSEFYWATPVHPCPSGVQLPVNADPDDPEHSCTSVLDPEPAPDLELMSFSGLSSLSSIELTPDSIQDDPDDASSVPGESMVIIITVSTFIITELCCVHLVYLIIKVPRWSINSSL